MRRARRVDANQPEIVKALRAIGCSVEPISDVGRGVPDLLVGYLGRNLLLEVKIDKGELTEKEEAWTSAWRGQSHVVRSKEEAIEYVLRISSCGRSHI